MKHLFTLLLMVVCANTFVLGQSTILLEDFEDNTLTFTASDGLFTDGTSDYFTIVPLNGSANPVDPYTSFAGSNFFAAEDIDDGGTRPSTQTLTFSVDITGATDLKFSGLFAVGGNGAGTPSYDDEESVLVRASIDGGTAQNLLAFEAFEPGGDVTNNQIALDTDFDGIGDGTIPNSMFTAYNDINITGSGTTLILEIIVTSTDGNSEFAFDNISVVGTTGPITPMISEFQPNPNGGDPAMVNFEISGEPSTMFDLWILGIESDGFNGAVDRATNVTGTFDANGLAVVSIPDFENPSFTAVLTDEFTGTSGSGGTDIDPNNDGTMLDLSTLGTIYDAIGIPDSEADALTQYGDLLGGEDFAYTGDEPLIVFRDGATGNWFAVNDDATETNAFDIDATPTPYANFDKDPSTTTFGEINPIYTAPVECILSSFEITSVTCSGDDVLVSGSFVANNGSGNYQISASSMFTDVAFSGGTDGTIDFEVTLTGPSTAGTVDFKIDDTDNTGCNISDTGVTVYNCPAPVDCNDLYIALVVDGPLSQGRPKVIKLCANDDIADLSNFGVGSANNGGGSDGAEFEGMTGGLLKDQCIFLTSHAASFKSYFAFDADYTMTGGAALINGDDAIELFCSNSIIDVYGDPNVDGSGQPWEYRDSWAYRNTTSQNGGTFDPANWTFGGPGALMIDPLDPDFTAGGADPLIPCIPIVEVTDPCACGKPENLIVSGGTTGRFHEVVQVTITPASDPAEEWFMLFTDGAGYADKNGTQQYQQAPMTHLGDGVYELEFWHDADVGYTAEITNGLLTNPIEVSNSCSRVDCALIPTMGQWALFILALLMSSLALGFMFNYKSDLVG